MIESKEEFNDLLNRLKAKQKENKLGKSLQIKLQAFLEVEELINLRIGDVSCSSRKIILQLLNNSLKYGNKLLVDCDDDDEQQQIDIWRSNQEIKEAIKEVENCY